MPRLNVEDSLLKDVRFIDLMIRLGGIEIALGAIVRAWMVAQSYYLKGDGTIPLDVWKDQRLKDEIIAAGLATVEGEGVRVRGADEQFGWLRQCSEAGKKSAARKPRTKVPQRTLTNLEGTLEKSQGSLTSSSSSFSLTTNTGIHTPFGRGETAGVPPGGETALATTETGLVESKPKRRGRGGTEEQRARVQRFVGAYVDAYQTKFPDQRPEDLSNPIVRGQIQAFAKDHPNIERACELVQVYFQLDRKWFATKGYDFITFKQNLNVIAQAASAGMDPESQDAMFARLRAKIEARGST